MTTKTAPAIELKNVAKRFGSRVILDGASLNIARGETQVILGQSGSGKSVLLKCILGLLPVNGGEIYVDGTPTTKLSEADRTRLMRRFGMLFQAGALFDSMAVWENVSFHQLFTEKMDPVKARKSAIENLEMVGLRPEVADQNPAELSGGMRKRAALARAISSRPDIIFYDEPTTGLDPITSDVISDLIRKLQRELKCTSVVITHDMACAFKVADSLAFLYDGRFVAEGTPEEFKLSKNPYLRQFIEGRAEGPIKVLA